MNETWIELTTRHSRETMEFIKKREAEAYCAGFDNSLHVGAYNTPNMDIRVIAEAAAARWDISVEEIRSSCRKRRCVLPRHEAFYHAGKIGISPSRIGDYFGGRDYTTVTHGIAMHKRRMEKQA